MMQANLFGRVISLIAKYLFVLFLVVLFFFPVAWILLTSIKTTGDIYAWPPVYIPAHPTLQNYHTVLFGSKLGRYILNSVIVSSLSTLSVLFFASLAGYSIARIRFRGRHLLLMFFLSMSMFPQLAIVPSLFIWFRQIGLINSFMGIVLAYTGLFSPLALWILATYFRTIPLEIEESAKLDGCSRLRILWSILMPLSIPGVIAASLIVFIQTWNEFFLALVILSKNLLRTATVGIALYPGEYAFPWELITTATFLAIVPIFALTAVFQKQIIGGLTAGSLK
ncbi:MAG TPA: carbohydrate ABC transporter permease [Spirochaetia bacterium]|nr:carbohydrate ABC transporter permease [Spirochaetia bacterium]